MNKRILSMLLAVLMGLTITPFSAAAALPEVAASYTGGVVTISGTGFISGAEYMVRVVNIVASSITAMGQTTADGNGKISTSITTGEIAPLSNYTVYVNYQDGMLAVQDSTITTEGGNSGGTGDTGDTVGGATPPAPQPSITTTTSGNNTTTSASTAGTTDQSTGKTTGTVDSSTATRLVSSAKSTEKEGKQAVVEIKLETTVDTKSAEVVIPIDAFYQLASETNADVKISTGIGAITFDATAIASISGAQTSGDIKIDIAKVDVSTLSDTVKQMVGDRPLYDFSVTAGGSSISSFGGGSASISVPYTPNSGEDKNAIIVYYIDDSGNLQTIRGAYNEAAGTVDFAVSHFSRYAVGHNKVAFADVASDAWYASAVTFIAARGITNGTEPGNFSPDAAITRGQYIVMLMRAYGIEPDVNPTNNFADAGNTYYTTYLAAAKRLGISTGIGDNKFLPNSEITRQDMFAILYRSLELLGELPENTTGRSPSSMFSDFSGVAGYAAEAMDMLVKGGIVNGSGGKLDPTGQSTRAQMAQVLYNLLSV